MAEMVSPRDEESWVSSHYGEAAQRVVDFLGDDGIALEGKRVADVGCGDGLIDLGLVHRGGPAALVGFDIVPTNVDVLLDRARRHGLADALPPELSFRA